VLDGNPALPSKGGQQPLILRPMCIVAKRSRISATAELLCIKSRNSDVVLLTSLVDS